MALFCNTSETLQNVGNVNLFEFDLLDAHHESFLSGKNASKIQQVGSSKACAHARNKLKLKVFARALASSNCSSLNL